MSKYVFLSYSSKNYEKALEFRQMLIKNGITVWMAPDSIPASSDYASEIPKAIRLCSAFVLLLTAESQDSQFVRRELGLAIEEKKKVIPLCTAGLEINDHFKFLLTSVQITYSNDSNPYGEIVERIHQLIPPDNGGIVDPSLPPEEPIIDRFECRIKKNYRIVDKGKLTLYENRIEFENEFGNKMEMPVTDILSCKASLKMTGKKTLSVILFFLTVFMLAFAVIVASVDPFYLIIIITFFLPMLILFFYYARAHIVIDVSYTPGKHGFFARRNHYVIDKIKKENRASIYRYLKIRFAYKVKLIY